jgi:hypothetical protein
MKKFTHRAIDVVRIDPKTVEGPMGAAGTWIWSATVNGTIVRGTSVEDAKRRIGAALDSDSQTTRDERGRPRSRNFK